MARNLRRFAYTALLLIVSATMAKAQGTTARFAGIVQDPSGAVLPGVEASLTNEGTSTVLHWRGRTPVPLGVTQTGGRPDLVDFKNAVNEKCCSYGNLQYLNTAAFALVTVPSSGRTMRRGTAGATALRGPGIWNLDLALGKNFNLRENTKFELRADMSNALNHTQYSGIQTNFSANTPGLVTSTLPARVIQVQARIAF